MTRRARTPKAAPEKSYYYDDTYFRTRKPNGPLTLAVGDDVGYARYFLKQLGIGPTDPWWGRRGKVVELLPHNTVMVQWNDSDEGDGTMRVATCNLAKPGPNLRWCE